MINTIIFDLGGVVLNRGIWLFREFLVQNYNVTNEQTIEVFIKKYYKPYFSGKISEEEFWTNSLKDLSINADWRELRNKLLNFFEPNKGMFELIDLLRKNGHTTVLLSDQTNEWWPILNKKYSISSHFDNCIISSEVGVHKPEIKIYEIALRDSKSQAEESLFIDDLENNLEPAKKIGMKTILFKNCIDLKKELISLEIKLK